MAVEFIDLLGLLKLYAQKKQGIQNCSLYGRVTRQLERPSNLKVEDIEFNPNGVFVELEVFAVNLKYIESYLKGCNVWNRDCIFMVNGAIIAYIDKSNLRLVQNDWYEITGTLRYNDKGYVCLFNFAKTKEGKWTLNPARICDLSIESWDRHSEAYKWINASNNSGSMSVPPYVKNLPRFESTIQVNAPILKKPVQIENVQQSQTQYYVPSNREFKRESRQVIKSGNEYVDKFKGTLLQAKSYKAKYIENLKNQYSINDDNTYLDYMLDGLSRNLKRKPSNCAMTGRVILRRYLDNFKGASKNYMGTTAGNYLADIFDEVMEYMLDHNSIVTASDIAWDLCKSAFSDTQLFYAGVVGIILGLPFDTLAKAVDVCESNDISIIRVFNENPYMLQFVSTLKYDDIERIALCFNRHLDKDLDEYRNITMLHAYITDTQRGNTIFRIQDLPRNEIGTSITESKYKTMLQKGTYLVDITQDNIDTYLHSVKGISLGYPNNFTKKGYKYVKPLSNEDLQIAIKQYAESGLGVVSGNYITSSTLMEREMFVYEQMKALGEKTFNYDANKIDTYINEYEANVGFKLEEMQRKAVHLSTNAGFIVAGGAGSGKTTVSNCIVYVLHKLEPELDIQFAAPTGKAAKRMQEVVHKEVKTLHSKFKLGTSDDTLFDKDEGDSDYGETAFFFDEGAMITIDLLYKVLKKVDIESSRVFLFGDFDQLPPIGKGLPFKNLLRFMPCVFLTVTKRAVEGSNITANSNWVNQNSESTSWHNLESKDDFFLVPCNQDTIQSVVYDLCSYYLGKASLDQVNRIKKYLGTTEIPKVDDITEDDIQVVSPLSKETYSWGTSKLNAVLEPLFNVNKNVKNTFIYKTFASSPEAIYSIGDRVIHIDKNMYSMQWYSSYENGEFQKIYGCGICNGEVGKVVDFLPSTSCDFYKENEFKPADFEYYKDLRDDSTWYGDNKWFVVVEYYDYISARNFYILYRAEDNQIQDNRGRGLKGDDLSKLNLFYAGTTHKLQGSQAKIIICALSDVNYSGFITRQMIYTMFTRGEKLVIAVGSVGNTQSSMLSRARRDVAARDVLTVGELII